MAKARTQKLKTPGRRRLKVFKTPIGFHDAYVAAPSRKAALEAWGSGTDLFTAGIAEEVKALTGKAAKAALATPGETIRVARSGGDEEPSPLRKASLAARPAARKKAVPKPSRAALERAEKALAALELKQAVERAELDKAEQALAKKRQALEETQAKARETAEAKRDAAEAAYRARMRDWEG